MVWCYGKIQYRMAEDSREQSSCFRLTRSLAHWLCVILLLMSMDVESNPGPEERADFIQFMDLRFSQIWQGMNVNTANICKMVDDKFKTLQQTLRLVTEEINYLKEQAQQDREDIQDLHDETEAVLCRLEKLEQKQESAEIEAKRCNLKFFGIQEPRRGMNYSCAEQIVDVLNDYSNGREWKLSDVKHAFRIGDFRQHGDEPRPLVVQFCIWTDKMSILTDRELREELRQDGIKVTGDLTSRQREMVEFYRNQGQTVYYRNGRLQFVDKWQQQKHRTPDYRRERRDRYGITDRVGEPTLHNEDWPYLPHSMQNRRGQNRHEDEWRRGRNDRTTDHPSDRNTGRPQLQHRHRGDSAEGRNVYSDSDEQYERMQTENGRPLHSNRHAEEGSNYRLSGQYRGHRGLNIDRAGDTEGGQHIAPGHRTYREVVQSGSQSVSKRAQQLSRPPINKARGLDVRPRPQPNKAGDRDTLMQQNQRNNWTDDSTVAVTINQVNMVRHVQRKNASQNDQQKASTNDMTTKDDNKQNGDSPTELISSLCDRNDMVHEKEDCDTDRGNDTTIQITGGHREQPSDCDDVHIDSDNEEDYSEQDNAELTGRTDRVVETAPDDQPAIAVQQCSDMNSHGHEDRVPTNIVDCEQNTHSHSQEQLADSENTNAEETGLSTTSDKTSDRSARNRQKKPIAQTRHTDGTPKTNRSSSQSSILDTLRQLGSKERSKEGRQECQGGTRTRAKSVHNK